MLTHPEQLAALAAHIARRRHAIMTAWRRSVSLDPRLTTGASLPRAQLHDHIPALLEDFERRLVAGTARTRSAVDEDQRGDAAAHGLHRWQQGFDLSEVTRELGRLNECIVGELEHCAAPQADPGAPWGPAAMADARMIWAAMHSVAIGASTTQYFKLQQLEAAGHVRDLEQALESLRDLEGHRAELWQQAAHDLRGNLGVVALATAGLTSARSSDDARGRFAGSLDRNVRALHLLLEDVTSLARLQGGQEVRSLAPMEASGLLRELAEGAQAMAEERRLTLHFQGPSEFHVVGDATKTRRIVQNLVFNAIKYTRQGGVDVNWGALADGEADAVGRWFIQVRDTGPGIDAGPGAPVATALGIATGQARDVEADGMSGAVTHVTSESSIVPRPQTRSRAPHQQSGEGIGLSIVKRLCELLDATIEVDSTLGEGTTFRILLPMQYAVNDPA